jgi:solute carrier family 10 (sodium/bile acid cotransporter), member 7
MNLATYLIFTAICLLLARPPSPLITFVNAHVADSKPFSQLPKPVQAMLRLERLSRSQTVAVCFCGAAKTTSLGIPLVSAMWASADNLTRAYIQIPVLLYTIEQVFAAQMLVYLFRRYLKRDQAGRVSKGSSCARRDETSAELGVQEELQAGDGRGTGAKVEMSALS